MHLDKVVVRLDFGEKKSIVVNDNDCNSIAEPMIAQFEYLF